MPGTGVLVCKDAFRGSVKAARALTEGSGHSVTTDRMDDEKLLRKMCPSGVHFRGDWNPGHRGG